MNSQSDQRQLPALPEVQLGRYRHCKGGFYDVVCVARDANNEDRVVVAYVPSGDQPDTTPWIRTAEDFLAEVEVDGALVNRFDYCGLGPAFHIAPGYVISAPTDPETIAKFAPEW